ncbi:hypothetical protein EHS25_003878 [Saitozyma podzolica]|uniref:Uncharacterized protein n=1 Tax=Saitozyma podzolica TaxID=1890683 RepID=A0A427Y3T3_9TREE|nr:hypothetical protein EHS25_003878 [Saitozyma podzolica]
MNGAHDNTTPRPLTMNELWASWDEPSEDESKLVNEGSAEEISEAMGKVSVGAGAGDGSSLTYPTPRSSYTLTPPLILLGARIARNTKLTIYKDIINFYSQDPAQKRYAELWKDLHSTEVQAYPIGIRVERANQGKEAANKKYKEGNWFGAMYTYALAWGCLLPYHLDAFAGDDPVREEIGKLESALFSNIAAMTLSASDAPNLSEDKKPGILNLGRRAVWATMQMDEFLTVGIVSKSCSRGIKLLDKLSKYPDTGLTLTPAEVGYFTEQEEKLKGVDAKRMWRDFGARRSAAASETGLSEEGNQK